MGLAFPPKVRKEDVGVIAADDVSPKRCQDLIDLHKNSQNLKVQGKIQQNNSNVVKMDVRQTDVFVIHEDFDWVDELIMNTALIANDSFGFNITGLIERPQLLRYPAASNGYDWHLDIGNGDHSTRKISISILLNDDYEGGELAFFTSGVTDFKPDAGVAIAFPSFLPHRVMPVTKGVRWSLVSWISGEPFR
jgi:PKHD-type hydroxylase